MSKPIVELVVSGASIAGSLDLFPDESILLQMNIANIKDVTQRSTPFTQSFYIPGTANNNNILTSIFEIGIDSVFDPRKKTRAIIYVDSIPITQNAVMQLASIEIGENQQPYYSVTIYEDTKNFFSAIDGKYLTDLSFNELSHVFNYSAVTNSWTDMPYPVNTNMNPLASTNSTNPYYYGLIDYGYYWSSLDLSSSGTTIDNMFPATSELYILDKIFSGAGFTYSSNFLGNSYNFTNNYILFNGTSDNLLLESFVTGRTFQAQMVSNDSISSSAIQTGASLWYGNYGISFLNDSTSGNFDNGNHFNATYGVFDPQNGNIGAAPFLPLVPKNVYTADTNEVLEFYSQIEITIPNYTGNLHFDTNYNNLVCLFHRSSLASTAGYSNIPANYGGHVIYNNVFQRVDVTAAASGGTYIFDSLPLDNPLSTTHYPALPNETFWVTFNFLYFNASVTDYFLISSANTYFWNSVGTQRVSGSTIPYNSYIPSQIKQIDFIDSLCKRYNLFIEASPDVPNQLNIEPRDDYYAAGTIKDWSSKVDTSKKYSQQLLSEQQSKQMRFKYKEDSDYLNDNYQNIENRTYGDFLQIFDNELTAGETDIEIIYSPTPLINVRGSTDFILPLITKIDTNGAYGQTNFNIRVLQANRYYTHSGLIPLASGETWNLNGHVQTEYPYLGHLDNPIAGLSTFDMNFGAIQFAYYSMSAITQNNLCNLYWLNTLAEINDKNSFMLTVYLYLTPTDINQLRYNDNIYLEGLTETSGAYYKINSIEYDATSSSSSKVELIKSLVNPATIGSTGTQVPNPIHHRLQKASGGITLGNSSTNSSNTIALGTANLIGYGANNSLVMGTNNTVSSPSSLAIGVGNVIQGGSQRSFVIGSTNTLNSGDVGSFVVGSSNTLGFNSPSIIQGNNNLVADNISSTIIGSNNIITGATGTTFSGVTLIGVSNFVLTATTNDTVYVPNIEFISSAGTINNININSITSGSTLWSAGTGTGSVFLNNGSGNIASGDYSYAEGFQSTALSGTSHAEGFNTIAFGSTAHSEGDGSQAVGRSSHAGGINSYAQNTGEWARSSGGFVVGQQYGSISSYVNTTNATPTQAFVGSTGSEKFIIGGSRYCRLYAVCTDNTTGDAKQFKGEGLIKNIAGTSLVGSFTMTSTNGDASLSTAAMAVTAGGATGDLVIRVTGVAATNIDWFIRLDYEQV